MVPYYIIGVGFGIASRGGSCPEISRVTNYRQPSKGGMVPGNRTYLVFAFPPPFGGFPASGSCSSAVGGGGFP